jgi:hypothetical protein
MDIFYDYRCVRSDVCIFQYVSYRNISSSAHSQSSMRCHRHTLQLLRTPSRVVVLLLVGLYAYDALASYDAKLNVSRMRTNISIYRTLVLLFAVWLLWLSI